ncbi:MAG: hypothetical protein ACXW0R_01655 [Gaiellaceae bacterium]
MAHDMAAREAALAPEQISPVTTPQSSRRSRIGRFVRHYFEMCVPMCVGFAVGDLVYFWAAGLFGYSEPFRQLPELSVLVVTFNMTAPMTAWMLFRGMPRRATTEMSAAMPVLAIVLLAFGWLAIVPRGDLALVEHGLMMPIMLIPMFIRLDLYTGRAGHTTRTARCGGSFASTIAILACASLVVLATGCGGSQQKGTSERESLTAGIVKLERAVPVEKKCEKLFGKLSKDLDGRKITTGATLKLRQAQVRACFSTVKKQTLAARPPLRSVLSANRVSEKRKYSPAAVGKMPVPAAAAYVLIRNSEGLNRTIDEAVRLVNRARLGAPLGASIVPGGEPRAISTLLFMRRYRALLEDTLKKAQKI